MKTFLLTPGDPGGIGAEITLKALGSSAVRAMNPRIVCVGAEAPFRSLGAKIHLVRPEDLASIPSVGSDSRKVVYLIPAPTLAPTNPPFPGSPWRRIRGRSSSARMEGFQAGWAVEHAARLVLSGQARALITGPIHKARLQAGGYPFSGHTDLLGSLCLAPENTMMLANEQLRVALVTVHTALARVSRGLTQEAVLRAISQTHESLQKYFGIPVPKIAVLALNPHAGEGGLFGSEEIKVIRPAIAQARRHFGKNAKISGPHPADTLFAQHILARPRDRYDAVVCMYHDQGLIPVKLLDFPKTVNITLGLPMIRTSVDHGTAFDIAGRNLADPSSLISAILLAVKMDRARSTRGVMKKMASSRSKRK